VSPHEERARPHRYAVAYLTTFLMLASVFAAYSVPMGSERAGTSYYVHSPIYIDGDADLLSQAASGSWNGTGAEGDPIEIRDWDIDASGPGFGIWMVNTRLFVSIDTCYIYSGYNAGIYLENVTNATILRCIMEGCNNGVAFYLVNGSVIADTQCSNSNYGLYLDSSSNISMSNVTCDLNSEGVYAYNVTDGRYVNSTFSYNSDTGIWLEECDMTSIDLCHADYNDYGVYAYDCYWMMFSNSTCIDEGTEGVYISASNYFMVANSTMTGTWGDGVYIDQSFMFFVADNNLSGNNYGANLYDCQNFGFEDNNITSNANAGVMADTCGDYGMRNNTCYEGDIGVYIYNSNGSIMDNTLVNSNYGLYVLSATDINIGENDLSYNAYGIYIESSVDSSIWNNTCSWCTAAGIYSYSVANSRFSNNNCSNDTSVLLLVFSDYNEITNNLCSGNSMIGIDLEVSNHNTVTNNVCEWNDCGIYLAASLNNSLMFNRCCNNTGCGVEVSASSDQTRLDMNTIRDNRFRGILVSVSRDALITNNYCDSNTQGGIAIESSVNATLSSNNMYHNGVWIAGNQPEYWYSHNIDQSNVVNGRPLVYIANETSRMVGEDAGQVIVANCQIVMVDGKVLRDATAGVEIGFSSMVRVNNSDCGMNFYGAWVENSGQVQIANSSFGDCDTGVEISFCTNVLVDNNTCWGGVEGIFVQIADGAIVKDNNVQHMANGIFLNDVHNTEVARNICNLNDIGIWLYGASSFISVRNNTCNQNSESGIRIDISDSCLLENNTCSDNVFGIHVWFSGHCTIKDNVMVDDGIHLVGYSVDYWNTHTIFSNRVNGKPVYYYKNTNSVSVPNDAGQVILANCAMMTVSGADLRAASVGVCAGFSTQVQILSVNCSDQYIGVSLFECDQFLVSHTDCSGELEAGISVQSTDGGSILNSSLSWGRVGLLTTTVTNLRVVGNLFYNNSEQAVYLGASSSSNQLYNNTFAYNNGALDNSSGSFLQAYDGGSSNTWYDSINSRGNYWNDWISPDATGDGIVDDPYVIQGPAGSRDMYPLVSPVAKFEPIPQFGLVLVVPLAMLLVVLAWRRRGK
jgi:parallel beta-helix repeat protein